MSKSESPQQGISDQTAQALVRQLQIMNRWLTVFGVLVLGTLAIVLFLLFQIVTFVRDTSQRVQSVGDSVNVQRQACQADGAFGDFVRSRTGFCD